MSNGKLIGLATEAFTPTHVSNQAELSLMQHSLIRRGSRSCLASQTFYPGGIWVWLARLMMTRARGGGGLSSPSKNNNIQMKLVGDLFEGDKKPL